MGRARRMGGPGHGDRREGERGGHAGGDHGAVLDLPRHGGDDGFGGGGRGHRIDHGRNSDRWASSPRPSSPSPPPTLPGRRGSGLPKNVFEPLSPGKGGWRAGR